MITSAHTPSGLETFQIQDHDLELTVIPGLGAKISSICWQGRELLALNPRKPLVPARYAAPYADYDASGFDECFPTIGPCPYPAYPWKGAEMPDHGEVWSLPWQVGEEDGSLRLSVQGVRIPYLFEKKITFAGAGEIKLEYTLTNPTGFPIHYLWSAHPLFAPQPGMCIYLPEGVRVLVDWSKNSRLGEMFAEHDWPLTHDSHGSPVDLSLILSEKAGLVDKLYTTRLPEGWCALHDPASGLFAAFLFSPQKVPYVGLSINLGGWPVHETGAEPGYYNLGLEPCSGFPDRLDFAYERGAHQTVLPGSKVEWDLTFRVCNTHAVQQALAELKGAAALDR